MPGPCVLNDHRGPVDAVGDQKGDGPAGVGKLHRVLDEVVHHLVQQVLVAVDHLGPQLLQAFNLQLLGVDALLKGEQGVHNGVADVKLRRVDLHLPAVNAGQVQHGLHQPGQPLHLAGHHLQILLLLLLGMVPSRMPSMNPAMVVIGVFSSWGHVGDKAPAHPLRVGQRVCHVVKGQGQLSSSSVLVTGTRTEKSPAPKLRAAADICRRGFTSR